MKKQVATSQEDDVVKASVIVGKHINGITLNGYDYLLDDNNEICAFSSKNDAISFLHSKGIRNDEIQYMKFFYDVKCPYCGEFAAVIMEETRVENQKVVIQCNRCKKELFIKL